MLIICDIDGTVADNSHRTHLIEGPGKKDWEAFYDPNLLAKDPPLLVACGILNKIVHNPKMNLHFLTGRPERTRAATVVWFHKIFQNFTTPIAMRPDGDHRKAHVYKDDMLQLIWRRYSGEPMLIIDDDMRNAEMYQKYGLFLLAPECWEVFK